MESDNGSRVKRWVVAGSGFVVVAMIVVAIVYGLSRDTPGRGYARLEAASDGRRAASDGRAPGDGRAVGSPPVELPTPDHVSPFSTGRPAAEVPSRRPWDRTSIILVDSGTGEPFSESSFEVVATGVERDAASSPDALVPGGDEGMAQSSAPGALVVMPRDRAAWFHPMLLPLPERPSENGAYRAEASVPLGGPIHGGFRERRDEVVAGRQVTLEVVTPGAPRLIEGPSEEAAEAATLTVVLEVEPLLTGAIRVVGGEGEAGRRRLRIATLYGDRSVQLDPMKGRSLWKGPVLGGAEVEWHPAILIEGLAPGHYLLESLGAVPCHGVAEVEAGRTTDVELAVSRRPRLECRVIERDATGAPRPLTGASIGIDFSLVLGSQPEGWWLAEEGVSVLSPDDRIIGGPYFSGPDGRVSLILPVLGEYSLEATKEGYRPTRMLASVLSDGEVMPIEMSREYAVIEFAVRTTAGTRVDVASLGAFLAPHGRKVGAPPLHVFADVVDGVALLSFPVAGRWMVYVERPTDASGPYRVDVVAGERSRRDLVVPAPARLRLDGSDVKGLAVARIQALGRGTLVATHEVKEGNTVDLDVAEGAYQVLVKATGASTYLGWHLLETIMARPGARVEVMIRNDEVLVRGIVVTDRSSPVSGAGVTAYAGMKDPSPLLGEDRRVNRSTSITDESGRFELPVIPVGEETTFLVYPSEHGPSARLTVANSSLGEEIVRIVVPSKTGTVKGTIRDGRGLPVPGAMAIGSMDEHGVVRTLVSRGGVEEGAYVIDAVPVGLNVFAFAPTPGLNDLSPCFAVHESPPLEIAEGRVTHYDVVMVPGATLVLDSSTGSRRDRLGRLDLTPIGHSANLLWHELTYSMALRGGDRVVIPSLPVGRYRVDCWEGSELVGRVNVDLPAGVTSAQMDIR